MTLANNADLPLIPGCRACGVTVRIPQREIDRLVADYFAHRPVQKVTATTYANRLEVCVACPHLAYGTTCRKCGCLVAVRAWLGEKGCPDGRDRWSGCCDLPDIADDQDVGASPRIAGSIPTSKD